MTSTWRWCFCTGRAHDLSLEGVIQTDTFTKVEFLHRTVMDSLDLSPDADACLVLANKYSTNPDAEDAANIMRVISIKNYSSDIRVIVQLMQYHNKAYPAQHPVVGLATWRRCDLPRRAETRFHRAILSCSRFLDNDGELVCDESPHTPSWLNDYLRGAGMEMYTEKLSQAFVGMSFPEAAEYVLTSFSVPNDTKGLRRLSCNTIFLLAYLQCTN
ncbi:hypothetical protein COOONC_11489 [Cooperia oncophora]